MQNFGLSPTPHAEEGEVRGNDAKISETRTGKKHTAETCAKISEAKTGKKKRKGMTANNIL